MPWTYAHHYIADALAAHPGQPGAASRQIMQAALNDARLLAELAGPHLPGIVAHAVAHVVKEQKRATEGARVQPKDPQSLNMPLDQFGRELLGALAGRDTPRFGQEVYGATAQGTRTLASKAHEDLIKKLARPVDK